MLNRIQKEVLRGWVKFPTGSEAEQFRRVCDPHGFGKWLHLQGFVAEPVESGTNSTVWMEEEYTAALLFVQESRVFWL